jgi:hypothetical protein
MQARIRLTAKTLRRRAGLGLWRAWVRAVEPVTVRKPFALNGITRWADVMRSVEVETDHADEDQPGV